MKKLLGAIFTSAFLSVGLVMNTQSAVVVNALDTGGDVVFSVAPGGSLDLTGTTLLPSTTGGAGFINPSPLGIVLLVQNPTSGFPADFYDSLTGPATFGPGGSVTGDSGTGLGFGWSATDGAVVVPDGYISGDPISGSLTFSSITLTALGVTPGTYVWSLPNDSITLNVGTVPIPAAGWLMSSGLVGLAGLGRYRKKA